MGERNPDPDANSNRDSNAGSDANPNQDRGVNIAIDGNDDGEQNQQDRQNQPSYPGAVDFPADRQAQQAGQQSRQQTGAVGAGGQSPPQGWGDAGQQEPQSQNQQSQNQQPQGQQQPPPDSPMGRVSPRPSDDDDIDAVDFLNQIPPEGQPQPQQQQPQRQSPQSAPERPPQQNAQPAQQSAQSRPSGQGMNDPARNQQRRARRQNPPQQRQQQPGQQQSRQGQQQWGQQPNQQPQGQQPQGQQQPIDTRAQRQRVLAEPESFPFTYGIYGESWEFTVHEPQGDAEYDAQDVQAKIPDSYADFIVQQVREYGTLEAYQEAVAAGNAQSQMPMMDGDGLRAVDALLVETMEHHPANGHESLVNAGLEQWLRQSMPAMLRTVLALRVIGMLPNPRDVENFRVGND